MSKLLASSLLDTLFQAHSAE